MAIRYPVVAGRFYEGTPEGCRDKIKDMLAIEGFNGPLPDKIVAGIVPHAGWDFSGDLAGMVFNAIRARQNVDTFVIFGAIHTVRALNALAYDSDNWATPLDTIEIDKRLAHDIIESSNYLVQEDCQAHMREHSIEVQVPFIQYLFPDAKIMPIMVPPLLDIEKVGKVVADVIKKSDKNIVCIGSTDLTHYGPAYGYTPMGTGSDAIKWAKETNDRFFIDLAIKMESSRLVSSCNTYKNACGSGAAAATVMAASELEAKKGVLLAHTTSAEVMQEKHSQHSTDSVGYAAIVY